MWEISIAINNIEKFGKPFFKKVKNCPDFSSCVITSYENNDMLHIVIGANDIEKTKICFFLSDLIADFICKEYKKIFIEKNLLLPITNKTNLNAFKKALILFDIDTDKYIVTKSLVLEKTLFLNSFYEFKLGSLRKKWLELIKLANENSSYLMCNDTFIELLKFLIDNIEISSSTINVIKNDTGYKICDEFFNEINQEKNDEDNDAYLITSLISLSPKNINIYCNESHDIPSLSLLSQLYTSRLHILPNEAEFN